jgi:hypothetical protein
MIGVSAQRRDQARLASHQIPFVDRDHQRPALALDQVGDAQILLLELVLRIHHQHHDFGKAHGAQRIRHRELFQLLFNARAAPQPGGVEHAKIPALPVDLDGDGIAGGAGLGAGQKAFFAEQVIDQRGFAGVGTANDGHADRPLRQILFRFDDVVVVELLPLIRGLRHQRAQCVVEIAQSLAMFGRDLNGIAETQRVGFHRAGIALLALALVGDQDHRLVGAAREIGKGAVVRREAGARVDHEHQGVGEADRGFGLLLHPRGQRALGALVEARGVDDGEFEIAETRFAFAAVARDAGFVIHQRKLLPDQPVEQRRFSDIGPADNGNRERHGQSVRALRAYSAKLCSGVGITIRFRLLNRRACQ